MERLGSGWLKRTNAPAARTLLPVAILLAAAITVVVVLLGHRVFVGWMTDSWQRFGAGPFEMNLAW